MAAHKQSQKPRIREKNRLALRIKHAIGQPPQAHRDLVLVVARLIQGLLRITGQLLLAGRPGGRYWSGIQLPWKPSGIRAGRCTRATGSPVKSCAASSTRSAAPRSGLWMKAST